MEKEYGGYLPFEGHIGADYFSPYGEEHILRTNSGKAAIFYAIQMMDIEKIYVPYYFCNSVLQMIKEMGIEVQQYYLDNELCPDLNIMEENSGIILVNYFGMMNSKIIDLTAKYRNIIIDQTHSFFSPPIFRKDIYNAYSCRKFIGVPDGGYLIGEQIQPMSLEKCKVSGHFLYLVESFECGTNKFYKEKLDSDKFFVQNYIGMSDITRCMLSAVDYDYIIEKRKENSKILNDILQKFNLLKVNVGEGPLYLYPFLTNVNIKKILVSEKIYVPTIWRELIRPEFYGTLEYELSNNTAFLPIDQRYGKEDMIYLSKRCIEAVSKLEETENRG